MTQQTARERFRVDYRSARLMADALLDPYSSKYWKALPYEVRMSAHGRNSGDLLRFPLWLFRKQGGRPINGPLGRLPL